MTHLLINSEGILGGNPDMELPVKPICECDVVDGAEDFENSSEYIQCNRKFAAYEDDIKRYWQGFVPFREEDRGRVKEICYKAICKSPFQMRETWKPEPSSIIEADIEYEVVWQYKHITHSDWQDGNMGQDEPQWVGERSEFEYRRVLRLKD